MKTHLWKTNPFLNTKLIKGKGSYVWGDGGRKYLDLQSGLWCNVLGQAHPGLIDAVDRQLKKITHIGAAFASDEMNGALSKLSEILPPRLNRLVFLNTGSEAVELALKMANIAAGADGVVAVIEKGYYGATSRAFSISEAGRLSGYPAPPSDVLVLPAPDCSTCLKKVDSSRSSRGCKFLCLDALEHIGLNGTHLAAVIYEPVMCSGGMIVPPIGYGAKLRELATKCGAFLIAEEVTTGIGRTGKWFGFEHDHIVPDILVIGKAIGAGLPVAVVATTQEVEDKCKGGLIHVQSHQNDPFSAAVAKTVVSIIQKENLVTAVAEKGKYFLDRLLEIKRDTLSLEAVRGRGLIVAAQLCKDLQARGEHISARCLEEGFIVSYHPASATFRFFPPYVITKREIDSFIKVFGELLKERE